MAVCPIKNAGEVQHARIQGGGGEGKEDPVPLKNNKAIGFLGNTSLDPLKTINVETSLYCQRSAIWMAFRWQADDGPL